VEIKMKKAKKIIAVLSLVIGLFAFSFGAFANNEEIIDNPHVSRFTVYQQDNKYTYLAGEQILFHTGISTVDNAETLTGSWLEIRVPRLNIVDDSFVASDLSAGSQISKTVTREGTATDGYFVVRYELQPIAGGVSIDVPIRFTTVTATPDNFQIPVTASFVDKDQQKLINDTSVTFTIKTIKPTVTKMVGTFTSASLTSTAGSWSQLHNQLIQHVGYVQEDNPNFLSED